MSDKYQGWTNWDTWNANLWLTNDEAIYDAAIQSTPEGLLELFEETFGSERFDNTYVDGIRPEQVNWQEIYNSLHEGE